MKVVQPSVTRAVRKCLTPCGASGGSGFLPTDISDIAVWLDASDETTVLNSVSPDIPAANGETVRRWKDKSGNAKDFDQSTGIAQPLLDAASINGLNSIAFDGVNDRMDGPVLLSSVGTIACVFDAGTDTQYVVVGATTPSTSFIFAALNGGTGFSADLNSGTIAYRANGADVASPNRDVLHDAFTARVNVAIASGFNQASWGETGLSANSGNFLAGSFCEVVAYDKVLDASEIAQLESYLSSKWGVALA